MKKPTSAKQIAANQRNAVKSTGPRTARGRAVSKMNAVKHGILSREVLVQGRILHESGEEFETLHRRFFDDLLPEGAVEEMLVDQIVTAHWRLRRALAAESGEIALGMDSGERHRNRGFNPTLQWMKWLAFGDPVHAMEQSSIGTSILITWLTELRDTVKVEGFLSEASIQTLAAHLHDKPNQLVRDLETFRKGRDPAPDSLNTRSPEDVKAEALDFLNRQIGMFQHMKWMCLEEEEQEEESRRSAALLPSDKVLDKILRYETKLERQIQRAMVQLERLQRMRRGESIPAPLSVEMSDRT
jgi:hypothetical protein